MRCIKSSFHLSRNISKTHHISLSLMQKKQKLLWKQQRLGWHLEILNKHVLFLIFVLPTSRQLLQEGILILPEDFPLMKGADVKFLRSLLLARRGVIVHLKNSSLGLSSLLTVNLRWATEFLPSRLRPWSVCSPVPLPRCERTEIPKCNDDNIYMQCSSFKAEITLMWNQNYSMQ